MLAVSFRSNMLGVIENRVDVASCWWLLAVVVSSANITQHGFQNAPNMLDQQREMLLANNGHSAGRICTAGSLRFTATSF